MLEKDSVTDSSMSGVTDVDPVASVVLVRVPQVVPSSSVECPCLTCPWMKIGLNFAAQRWKGVRIVIMLPPEVGLG